MAVDEPIFTIGGIDFTDFVDVLSIVVTDGGSSDEDSMSFNLVMSAADLDGVPGVPKGGEIVSLSVAVSSSGDLVKQFEGVLASIDQAVHQSRDNYTFPCKVTSYTRMMDKLVIEEMGGGTAGSRVRFLIRKYLPGFGTRFVREGFVVPEDDFDHVPITSVFSKYASAIGFIWFVDFDREIHFSEGEVFQGPIDLIDLDTNDDYGDVLVTEDISQLRNRVYIKDATSRSAESRRDTFVADDNQSFFKLFSPPFDEEDVKVFKNSTGIDLLPDTLTTQDGEIEGGEGLCFLCILNQGLRFPLSDLPKEGDIIDIDYFPEEAGGDGGIIVVMEDPDSIRMMRNRESTTGFVSDGVHEHIISAPQLRVRNLDPLAFLGSLVLDRLAWPEIRGQFTVSTMQAVGWRPGQSVILQSSKRNLFSSRTLWREGRLTDVRVHVQSVTKKFIPYTIPVETPGGGTEKWLFQETVTFSSVPQRGSL